MEAALRQRQEYPKPPLLLGLMQTVAGGAVTDLSTLQKGYFFKRENGGILYIPPPTFIAKKFKILFSAKNIENQLQWKVC